MLFIFIYIYIINDDVLTCHPRDNLFVFMTDLGNTGANLSPLDENSKINKSLFLFSFVAVLDETFVYNFFFCK